ncbi:MULTISPECIES: hypothetical protein [unclassified Pseudomonas]|uniref:hypothetical protein n=1 Tax=unclassified Pseudomonas TaxID=196821 RepID=UPI0030DB78C8
MATHPEAVKKLIAAAHKLRESHFGTFGRFKEHRHEEMSGDEKKAYDLVKGTRSMVPGPYKIWVRNLKLTEVMVHMGSHYQAQHTLSKAEIEIAVLLTAGRWMASYASYEHEWMAEVVGGLPAEKVQALVAGLPTSFEDARQQVIYDMSSALLAPRIIPVGLYQRAVGALGHDGLTDLIAFIGYFTTVSLTLRAYDVPANAVGLDDQ